MKRLYTFIFVLSVELCCGQKQFNNWFFGDNAGITFNGGSPANLSGGALYTTEGCASMSDSTGKLLFYTEGVNVYNANNVLMTNGTGLNGGTSASQSAFIIPDPANANLYYIFTVAQVGGAAGCNYSKVDMTQSGGLGSVTVKNMQLITPTDEKLTATRRTGGGYWVIVHALSSSSNAYYAYPVTTAGVGSPVISNTGALNTGINPWTGHINVSPDGTSIANALYAMYQVEISDFDAATGIISNTYVYNAGSGNNMYGVSFSATGNVLYAANVDYAPYNIFQLNMRAGSQAAILASGILLYTSSNLLGSIQLAPDKKLYVALYDSYYLGVINNPDSLGVKCNYVNNGFATTGMVLLGLPDFVAGAPQAVVPPTASFNSVDTAICANACISFNNLSSNATSYQWSFPGAEPPTSTDANPFVCYLNSGTFDVTLVAANSGGTDTLTLSNYIDVKDAPPIPDITQVNDSELYCSKDPSYTSYQWYVDTTLITGATDTLLVIKQGGNYNVRVSNVNGCSVAVGINIVLGMQHYMSDPVVSISPNPAQNKFTVYGLQFTVKRVNIFNVLGQVCQQSEITNPKSEIDVSMLPQGIYFVQMTGEKERWVGKFVKE